MSLGSNAMPNEDDIPDDGWAQPRLNYLDKLIAAALNGTLPQGDDLATLSGLDKYIAKKLPNYEAVAAKLGYLRRIMSLGSKPMPNEDEQQEFLKVDSLYARRFLTFLKEASGILDSNDVSRFKTKDYVFRFRKARDFGSSMFEKLPSSRPPMTPSCSASRTRPRT
jgi:hypothetical protein